MPIDFGDMTSEQLRAIDLHIQETVRRASEKPWYHLNLSQLVTVSVVIFGAVVSIGWFQRDLEMLKVWRSEITVRIAEIDARGTAAGRSDIGVLKTLVQQHESRLAKVEDARERLLVIENKIDTVVISQKKLEDRLAPP